ncbi:MAG: hypothetical protein KKE02_05810 [Alphaproteobacteria bacterium]|nr:hypothetical protein [Alphaproteobacteria bacterium]MBU1512927.1 hypothetical protein [Alphaproteobacteria bacterium]MBU2096632.1 hypothetical protein [Alphaproteobacteria bacterium]MBU2150515.1 hypothetical protein [Alphaproteobacteria bacterium]MBU2306556.1 hypothetical protein [Alphaproteobacteria bacterium]
MADEATTGREMIDSDFNDDPATRAGQIDVLMAGPPAELPSIVVVGDDAVFGLRPIRRQA